MTPERKERHMDTMSLARDERADLAEFLAMLSSQQWGVESLCSGWRVRDVIAHLLSYDELDIRALVGRFARAARAARGTSAAARVARRVPRPHRPARRSHPPPRHPPSPR
jgi:uncharacterized protein (TIGR03083 family)